jgi:hypothetical protein
MRWICAGLNHFLNAVLILVVLSAVARPARAYVDPGSGIFILQILTSTFAGMIFMLRKRLNAFFRGVALRSGSKREKAAKV